MRNTNDEICDRSIVCIFHLNNQFDISWLVGELRMELSELEEKSMHFCHIFFVFDKHDHEHGNKHGNYPILASAHGWGVRHSWSLSWQNLWTSGSVEKQGLMHMVIQELQKHRLSQRDANWFVPDMAIKVASLLDNPSDDCSILASILKNLVESQAKNANVGNRAIWWRIITN